jgi:hypothetical protein
MEGAVGERRETLAAVCQVAGICAAALLVPCYLIDVVLDTDIVTIVLQGMLAAFACALVVAVWTSQED